MFISLSLPLPVSISLHPSLLQGYYQKAKVLQQMDQVDESLQVFLHCLALDEGFPRAKREVELVRDTSSQGHFLFGLKCVASSVLDM